MTKPKEPAAYKEPKKAKTFAPVIGQAPQPIIPPTPEPPKQQYKGKTIEEGGTMGAGKIFVEHADPPTHPSKY